MEEYVLKEYVLPDKAKVYKKYKHKYKPILFTRMCKNDYLIGATCPIIDGALEIFPCVCPFTKILDSENGISCSNVKEEYWKEFLEKMEELGRLE